MYDLDTIHAREARAAAAHAALVATPVPTDIDGGPLPWHGLDHPGLPRPPADDVEAVRVRNLRRWGRPLPGESTEPRRRYCQVCGEVEAADPAWAGTHAFGPVAHGAFVPDRPA